MVTQTSSWTAGVADDAALADASAPGLELRLDEGDEPGVRGGERERGRQNRAEADEARVADDEVHRLRHLGLRQVTRVGPFQYNDARVVPQPGVELTVADIDRVDAPCATAAKNVSESAGGRADIQRNEALRIDPEVRQRVVEFLAAARNPGVLRATHREHKVAVDPHARLVEPAFAGEHEAGQQQRLRLGPGLGKAARHEQGIEPFLAGRSPGRCLGALGTAAAQWRRSTM